VLTLCEDSSSPAWPYTPESLSKADVVVTSNETLRSDHEDAEASETSFRRPHSQQLLGRSPLLAIYWLGVFFDEAHRMNNENTGIAKAAKRLRALTWLPITGTPLQNEYSDIRSMAQLLNVRPLCIPHFFSQVSSIGFD
jgi:SNF2 family DNA or RNA helicase